MVLITHPWFFYCLAVFDILGWIQLVTVLLLGQTLLTSYVGTLVVHCASTLQASLDYVLCGDGHRRTHLVALYIRTTKMKDKEVSREF